MGAKPNAAHDAIAGLETQYDVVVITQNIGDLHERAGSSYVIHVHGEIMKARSSSDPSLIYPLTSLRSRLASTAKRAANFGLTWFGSGKM